MTPAHPPLGDMPIDPCADPVGRHPAPLGSAASLRVQSTRSPEERQALMVLAKQVLADPVALRTLGDRVYALLQEEFRHGQEHRDTYDARFWR